MAPADPARAEERDRRLDAIDETVREKKDELRPLLPALKRTDDLAGAPSALLKALPADAAFVDLLRYVRVGQDPKVPGKKGETRTPHYVAFLATDGKISRVELGDAGPIEAALGLWRRAIEEGSAGKVRGPGG